MSCLPCSLEMEPEVMGSSLNASFINNSTALAAYLEKELGPRRLPDPIVIPITVAYALIFFTGIAGNSCTCFVIVRNKSMHTATDLYLLSLAIADLLTLILGLPNDLSVYWQQYPYLFGMVVCRTRAFVSEMTSNASVLTIVAFTSERYVAICRPLVTQTLSSLSRVFRVIAVVWFVAGVSAIPFAYITTVNYIEFPEGSGNRIPESAFCSVSTDPAHSRHQKPLFQFSSFVFFVIPLIIIIGIYIRIGITLRASRIHRQMSDKIKGTLRGSSSRRSILKILVAVVIAFFVCWAPFHAQRLLYVNVEDWTEPLRKVNETLFHMAGCCYYLNCTINPILYNVISRRYREAFKDTLCCVRRRRKYAHSLSISSSLSFHMRRNTSSIRSEQTSLSFRSSPSCRSVPRDVATIGEISTQWSPTIENIV